jgi:hypothetical protein
MNTDFSISMPSTSYVSAYRGNCGLSFLEFAKFAALLH